MSLEKIISSLLLPYFFLNPLCHPILSFLGPKISNQVQIDPRFWGFLTKGRIAGQCLVENWSVPTPNPYIFIPFLQAGCLFCHHYHITLTSSPQLSTFLSATSKNPSSLDCRLRTAAPLQRADIVLQPCLEQNLRWEALQDNLTSWQSFRIQMQRWHLKVPLPSRQLFKIWASIYR